VLTGSKNSAFKIILYLSVQYSVVEIFNNSMNKLKSVYNKCIKLSFGYRRCYSVTNMLLELGLPGFNTILVNGLTVSTNLQLNCANALIMKSLQL